MKQNELICISNLITERKWTRNLIRDFLGEPDESVPNPYYPESHPVKLYKLSRVRRTEREETFLVRMRQIKTQRKIAKRRLNGGY